MDLTHSQSSLKLVKEVNQRNDCYLKERVAQNQHYSVKQPKKHPAGQAIFLNHSNRLYLGSLFFDYSKAIIKKGIKRKLSSNLKGSKTSQSQLPQGLKANRIRLAVSRSTTPKNSIINLPLKSLR